MTLDSSLADQIKLGCVSFSEWAEYAWKNELHEQRHRVVKALGEIIGGSEADHNPHHMLQRAFGVVALCMRRLIECRLVTDEFRESGLTIFQIDRLRMDGARSSFLCSTGGDFFKSYDMSKRKNASFSPDSIANKFLHCRYLAVLTDSAYLPNGILVASDHQAKDSLFHMTPSEFDQIVGKFLDDRIGTQIDGINSTSGVAYAIRESAANCC